MYTLPQEIEVWYVIPAIRKELSNCLVRDHKVSYQVVGDLLGITKAAVSQYIKHKRAAKVKLPKEALVEVGKACKLLISKKSHAVKEIMRILKLIRDKDLACEVCDKSSSGVLEGCREVRINKPL